MCMNSFIREVCDGDLQQKMANSDEEYPTHAMREWVTVADVMHLRSEER